MGRCLIFLLFTFVACTCLCADAQVTITNPEAKDEVAPPASSSVLPADAPVIKIKGLCSGDPSPEENKRKLQNHGPIGLKIKGSPAANKPAPANPGCESVVTRAEYEKLAGVVAPKQEPAATIQLADFYSTQMVYAEESAGAWT